MDQTVEATRVAAEKEEEFVEGSSGYPERSQGFPEDVVQEAQGCWLEPAAGQERRMMAQWQR